MATPALYAPPEAVAFTFDIWGDEEELNTPTVPLVPPEAVAVTFDIVDDDEEVLDTP